MILLARSSAGWRSLCRIVSRRRSAPPGPASDPVPDVLAEADGIVALSDDPDPIVRLLRGGIPRESLRLLLVRPARSAEAEKRLLLASRRHRVRLVADLEARVRQEHRAQLPAKGDRSSAEKTGDGDLRVAGDALDRRRASRELTARGADADALQAQDRGQ